MAGKPKYHDVEIGGVKRSLRLFEIKPGLRIAILNILGDTELVQACAKSLAKKIKALEYDTLVTAESKSIPLAHALSVATQKPYVVLRKAYKVYMGKTLQAQSVSITTGKPQTLYLDEKDRPLIRNKRVLIVDDVISTGSTLDGMREIVRSARGKVAAVAAIFTEGDADCWQDIISLGNLPLFD